MFQAIAFQVGAFQSVFGAGVPQPQGGLPYIYQPNYRQEEKKRQIKKTKTEIEKVSSVIGEYERKRALAEKSLSVARETERNRLLSVQNELIAEINRLLMVKAELMARKKRQEEELIIMMIASRRKFRAFNLTTQRI